MKFYSNFAFTIARNLIQNKHTRNLKTLYYILNKHNTKYILLWNPLFQKQTLFKNKLYNILLAKATSSYSVPEHQAKYTICLNRRDFIVKSSWEKPNHFHKYRHLKIFIDGIRTLEV